ncbi:hypothetical protein EVAR_50605_1 [Eumeta japonica]|uniref:Uncharacterized protein n=1 Tax=Eumeta variegata TaxID=151549 RepID=A0A4C1YAQ5_EUMVA|nr:hypothetical protein EVAR_50605_1 [Eumeta japonica]
MNWQQARGAGRQVRAVIITRRDALHRASTPPDKFNQRVCCAEATAEVLSIAAARAGAACRLPADLGARN